MDNAKGIGRPKDDPSVKKGKNYFLGVGINDYSSGWTILNNAVRDVERIGQILKDKYDFYTIDILTNDKATRLGILRQLRALQTLTADDSLLIYYSGHGHLAKEDGYWIPVNADTEDIDNYIPNAQLHGLIKAIPTWHTLLIADACFSGSFFPESDYKTKDHSAADNFEKKRSRWAFCSGRHDQKVSDGPIGTHSPFAEALITELERNNRPKVYIQELAIPVINRTAGKYRQTPKANLIFDCGDDGGQFVFSLKDFVPKQTEKPLSKFEELEKQLEDMRKLIAQQPPQYNTIGRQDVSISHRDNIVFANIPITDTIINVGEEPIKIEAGDPINFEIIKEKPLKYKVPKIIIPKTKFDFEPKMVFVKAGTFIREYQNVTVSDFCIGKYPVTQAQWKAIANDNPSFFDGNSLPVEQVNWDDCQEFIKKLNKKTKKNYRLPTEAEWEFAARGGNLSNNYEYSGSNNIDEVAWFDENSGDIELRNNNVQNKKEVSNRRTRPVGVKKANELGIYDMSGNVWEWCNNWFGDYSTILTGPKTGTLKVARGGCWNNGAEYCRVSCRGRTLPSEWNKVCGFRLALSVK